MTGIGVDIAVELTRDFPELGLRCGEVGLVCSIWFAPIAAYEVEFERKPPACGVRALVMPSQIRVAEAMKAMAELAPPTRGQEMIMRMRRWA